MQSNIVYLFLTGFSIIVCSASDGIIGINLFKMKSPLQTFAEMGLHPSKVHRMFEELQKKFEKKTTNASVPLFKFFDSEFYGEVMIGQPGQKFKVVFDTAWANSWVPSTLCPYTHIACVIHNKYDCSASNTCKRTGKQFNVNVGSYNLTGTLSTDLFHVGQVNVSGQTFAEIENIPWVYIFNKADGVIGLAFDKFSVDNVTPLFYNMLKQGVVAKPVFSFYMNRDPVSDKGGTLFFGGVETRHFTGNFTFAKIVRAAYWQFHMDRVLIQGDKSTLCKGGCDAIADTSANTISGPEKDIKIINNNIKAKEFFFGRYVVDCELMSRLPHIAFTISGQPFKLKSRDYIQKVSWGGVTVCLSTFVKSSFPSSFGDVWVLGGSFLSRFYVQFDLGNYRIGFAEALF